MLEEIMNGLEVMEIEALEEAEELLQADYGRGEADFMEALEDIELLSSHEAEELIEELEEQRESLQARTV